MGYNLVNNKILDSLIPCFYLQNDDDSRLRAVVLAVGINQTDNVEKGGNSGLKSEYSTSSMF